MRRELGRLYAVPTDDWVHLHTAEIPRALPALPAASPGFAATSRWATACSWQATTGHPSQQGALVSGGRAAEAVLADLGA